MKKYVLSVLVENHAGVLSRVSGLFSRRGYNIDSLTVCETADPEKSRMTIVVRGDEYILEQIEKQLLQVVTAYRLFMPYASITVSTRECARVRDSLSS